MRGAIADILNDDLSRTIIAVLLLVGTFGLLFQGKDVPAAVWTLDGAAVTFYFIGRPTKDAS